ncbi:ROK family protein [Stieleria varia]|uniref:Glucokinase n=1 Tax=Stieleria varia TaxID=2528005 RepID=A0A5C6A3D7_9BACT|nr:ROK family protein [Stieleria varia]TWT93890.1 Glucokinase [Stieleria varia]
MNSDFFLGIDVGGTDIKLGLVDDRGNVHFKHQTPTRPLGCPDAVFEYAIRYANETLLNHELPADMLRGVGVAVPGVLDTRAGVLREVVNLPGWLGVSLIKHLAAITKLPTQLINDANAAAYAEHVIRSLGDGSLALLTLGTGIGGGLVLSGRPHGGDHGCAGELGHITIDFSDTAIPCTCGSRGHLESYAGAPAVLSNLQRRLRALPVESISPELLSPDVTTRDIATHAEKGCQVCVDVMMETACHVGKAIGMLGQVCNPEVVILGGAMTFGGEATATGRMFLDAVRESVKRTTLVQVGGNMDIQFASLGNDAGVCGAGMIARHRSSRSAR